MLTTFPYNNCNKRDKFNKWINNYTAKKNCQVEKVIFIAWVKLKPGPIWKEVSYEMPKERHRPWTNFAPEIHFKKEGFTLTLKLVWN